MTGDLSSESTVFSGYSAPKAAPPQSSCGSECSETRPEHQPLLDEIQSLLEAMASRQAGIRTPAAMKLEAKFARAVSLYFQRLTRSFPYSTLSGFVSRYGPGQPIAEAKTLLLEAKKEDARKLIGKAVEGGSEDLRVTIESHATRSYELGSKQAAAAVRVRPTFALVDDGAKRWLKRRAATQVTNINETTRDRLARILVEGVDKGQSVPKIAGNIRTEITDMSRYRAKMIAQNELNEAMSEASLRTYERLEITHKSWSAALEPCEICEANEAEGIVPIDHMFSSGHKRPPAHPNCLLPDIRVEASHIIAGSRAFYRGKAIELTTEKGNSLTITPNHMILTHQGFIKAKSLVEGDYIISSPNSERIVSGIDPDNYYRPTFIADIWDSLMMKRGMVCTAMPIAPEDFHGDATNFDGYVDIVRADSFLMNNSFYPLALENIGHEPLGLRDTQSFNLSGLSALGYFGKTAFPSPGSNMGSLSQSVALLDRHSSHADDMGFSKVTGFNTSQQESTPENIPVYTSLARQFLLSFSSLVSLDKIVKIRDFDYSGQVYDLQSLEQLYIANNIVVKNCLCTLTPEKAP